MIWGCSQNPQIQVIVDCQDWRGFADYSVRKEYFGLMPVKLQTEGVVINILCKPYGGAGNPDNMGKRV